MARHGGKREGAGRKPGSRNALPLNAVNAIKAAGLRVPESATAEQRELADQCLETLTKVMQGKVDHRQAPHRLKASTVIREEICGPIKQKVEHSFDGLTDEQLEARKAALLSKWTASGTPPPDEGGKP